MKKSNIILILAAICLIITIICIITWSNYQDKADKNVWSRDFNDEYRYDVDKQMAEREYKQGRLSYSEYQQKIDTVNTQIERLKENKDQDRANKMIIVCFAVGTVTVILVVTGIVFKVKEKRTVSKE